MKKLFIIISITLFLSACTKDITRFNEETKRASSIPPGPLFSNAVKSMSDGLASSAIGVNIFRHFVKHWAQAVIQDEAQYDYISRAVNDAWWTIMYRDVLNDLKESSRIITNNNTLNASQKANQLAMIDIMQVYTYNILINTFGDIPYTEALNDQKLFPVYDDAKTVYADLLKRVAESTNKLNTNALGFTASEDLIFQGNIAKWVKFGNSLQIRMAMTIADVDNNKAKSTFELVEAAAMNNASDIAEIKYFSTTPNNNPLYNQLVLANRTDFIAAVDLMDVLNNLSDPRKPGFFGLNNANQYVGGIVGTGSDYAKMSKPSNRVAAPDAPNVIMDYAEMEFYRAEAKERGYNVSGTAELHYNNAIRASITLWGGSNIDAATYLARPEVAYTTAAGNWKKKIGMQKWIALYNRPFEGWLEMRRLDHPVLSLPVNAISGFPTRLRYPGNEQQLNGTNYTNAAAKIGGDKTETKLFWDIQ